MLDPNHQRILENHPFLSYVTYGGNDYIGVIQNCDDTMTTIYDYAALKTTEQKTRFLTLAEQWWWESNRLIPINIFLKQDWAVFKLCLRAFNSKDVTIQQGPTLSLKLLASQKGKRRSITLIKKIN